jgi:hypothetical protein
VQGLPQTGAGSTPWLYGLVLLAMGLLTSWPGPVCNVVVFAEVVPEVRHGLLRWWYGSVKLEVRASPGQRLAQLWKAKRLDALRALQHLRTLIYAFDRSLEGALAACGAPLVGYLAQHAFGFKVLCLSANGAMSMGQLTSSSH